MQVAKAHVKMQRISARKARLVADLIRHKEVKLALGILNNTNKKASQLFIKLLNSAIANATNNHGMDASRLFIDEILVNEGPTLKRYQAHSQGRAYQILKRTSHFSITLVEYDESEKVKRSELKKLKTKEPTKKSDKKETEVKSTEKEEAQKETKKTVKKASVKKASVKNTKKEDK